MKKLLINLTISKGLCFIVVLCNLVFPLYQGQYFKFIPLQIILIVFWLYGLACHLGYFKVQTSLEDGKRIYEPSIPIIQIAACRIIETTYFWFAKKGVVDWKIFIILVGMDVIYIIFILLDKATYYYEVDE